jgi:hypothetical protein
VEHPLGRLLVRLVVKQYWTKFLRIENIHIEMNGKVRNAFAGNPRKHGRRTLGQRI